MEITQDKSYRLLVKSGRNYNLKIKATENTRVGKIIPPKRQEKAGSRAERRLDLPHHVLFVTHSMTVWSPWLLKNKSTVGLQDRHG